jgi:hypothetical protein
MRKGRTDKRKEGKKEEGRTKVKRKVKSNEKARRDKT